MEYIICILLMLILFGILSIDARLKKRQESDKLLMGKLDEYLSVVNRK